MRVAVTGATGFIGGFIARFLFMEGHDVTSFGRRLSCYETQHLPSYRSWDFTDGSIDARGFDGVVHCGASVSDWGTDAAFLRVNVDGTAAVMKAFGEVGRFIHVSTSSVYSDHVEKHAVDEGAHIGACRHSAYARSKAAAEHLVLSENPSAVILRPHVVYGPGDTTLLPRLVDACRMGILPVPGTGRNSISTTHVENFALAVQCALGSNVTGVFNVTDGADASVHDLLTTMLDRHGIAARPLYIPEIPATAIATTLETVSRALGSTSAPRITRYMVAQLSEEHTLNISRARKMLGYSPRWTFRNGPVVWPEVTERR